MARLLLLILMLFLSSLLLAQDNLLDSLYLFKAELEEIEKKKVKIDSIVETLKLKKIRQDIRQIGTPAKDEDERVIEHSAIFLSYNEQHEQANWVMHIIVPDIFEKRTSRSNDFRPDPKVLTGSAEEIDYFIKTLQEDSTYEYDGFGYDRGHLAPSADFRWSKRALSESYYYSNISPQVAEFNREKWSELESEIRSYLYKNKGQLYVVTGPILTDNLPAIERSLNKVSIPEYFFKVIIDYSGEQKRGIGFIMPNQKIEGPLDPFAVTIDSVENLTGYNFFPNLPPEDEKLLESKFELIKWLGDEDAGDVAPLSRLEIPRGYINTVQANTFKGSKRKLSVCGTVVSSIESAKGNVFLNMDKRFPNQIFTVLILKKNQVNFPYIPSEDLYGKKICVTGNILDFDGTPTMIIEREKQIEILK